MIFSIISVILPQISHNLSKNRYFLCFWAWKIWFLKKWFCQISLPETVALETACFQSVDAVWCKVAGKSRRIWRSGLASSTEDESADLPRDCAQCAAVGRLFMRQLWKFYGLAMIRSGTVTVSLPEIKLKSYSPGRRFPVGRVTKFLPWSAGYSARAATLPFCFIFTEKSLAPAVNIRR